MALYCEDLKFAPYSHFSLKTTTSLWVFLCRTKMARRAHFSTGDVGGRSLLTTSAQLETSARCTPYSPKGAHRTARQGGPAFLFRTEARAYAILNTRLIICLKKFYPFLHRLPTFESRTAQKRPSSSTSDFPSATLQLPWLS